MFNFITTGNSNFAKSCSDAHCASFLFYYNCTQKTGQIERDKCSLLLCFEILDGYVISKFFQACPMLK